MINFVGRLEGFFFWGSMHVLEGPISSRAPSFTTLSKTKLN